MEGEGGRHKGESIAHSGPSPQAQHPYPSLHRAAAEDNFAKVTAPPGRAQTRMGTSAHLEWCPVLVSAGIELIFFPVAAVFWI